MTEKRELREDEMDDAPFLGSWKAIYLFVMAFFVVLIGLFYWFTVTYQS
ncbi:MAG: hypothetical protein RIE86_08395 [Imperialibacter sp.]